MYTATLIGDTKNIELRRRMVNVEFTNGTVTFAKEFQFKVDETVGVMKRAVKAYLDELNAEVPALTGGIADVPAEPAPVPPTAAELAKTEWDADRNKLKTLMELVRDGVFTGSETQITALQAKVKAGFKVGYLG